MEIRFKAKTDAQETSVLTLEDYLDVPLEQEQTNLQTCNTIILQLQLSSQNIPFRVPNNTSTVLT